MIASGAFISGSGPAGTDPSSSHHGCVATLGSIARGILVAPARAGIPLVLVPRQAKLTGSAARGISQTGEDRDAGVHYRLEQWAGTLRGYEKEEVALAVASLGANRLALAGDPVWGEVPSAPRHDQVEKRSPVQTRGHRRMDLYADLLDSRRFA